MAVEWPLVELSRIAKLRSGFPFKSSSWTDDGVPVIKISHVKDGRITKDGCGFVSPETATQAFEWMTRPGDILMAMTGYVGEVARVRGGEKFLINQRVGRFEFLQSSPVIAGFLYYYLRHPKVRIQIETTARGSAQPNLSAADAAKLLVPAPPLNHQRAIAHILGTLDDKIELNRRRNQTLEAMARALFKDWFVDFGPVRAKMEAREPYLPANLWQLFPDRLDDDGKPEGWEMQSLANFIDIFDSRRVPLSGKQRAERLGPYPYYGAAGVLDSVDDFLFEGVHVLLGEDGSVVRADGRPYTQYVWGKFWVNNHAHVLRGRGISNEALLIFLDQCDVAPFVTGAVQPKLSQGNLKAIPFFYPGEVLLRRFGEIIDPLFAQIRDATEESRTLAQLRDTLLPKLISGELRISDAEKFMERVA